MIFARTPFDVIMIYTKQKTPLSVENCEMAAIILPLEITSAVHVCPLIDDSSRPIKSKDELWLLHEHLKLTQKANLKNQDSSFIHSSEKNKVLS